MVCLALRQYAHPRLTMHFVSNVDGHDIDAALAKVDPGDHAVHHRLQDLHHRRNHDERADRARLVPAARAGSRRWRATSSRYRPTPKRSRPSASTRPTCSRSGTGSAAAIRYGRRSACRSRWRSASATSATCWPARTRWTCTSSEAPLDKNMPVLLGLIGFWNRQFLGCASVSIAPYHQDLNRFPAYLQQLDMESNGKRVTRDGQPVDTADLPGDLGRLRHQRPARLLPAAAPGHRRDADRLHRRAAPGARIREPPRGAAGQLLRAVRSLHARQNARRSARRPAAAGPVAGRSRAPGAAQDLPRQPPEQHHPDGVPDTRTRWARWSRCTSTRPSCRACSGT